jgi:hypothetical protein
MNVDKDGAQGKESSEAKEVNIIINYLKNIFHFDILS